jgi:hypothetical protein
MNLRSHHVRMMNATIARGIAAAKSNGQDIVRSQMCGKGQEGERGPQYDESYHSTQKERGI